MDKSKILRMCNEIEDIACDISQQTMNDIVSAESRMIFDKSKEITAEITAPKKSNADHIRQMTDEELAEFLRNIQIGALAAQFTNTGIDLEGRDAKRTD